MRTIRDEDRKYDDDDTVSFDGVTIVHVTSMAMRVNLGDKLGERWVPHSQVHDDSEVYVEDNGTVQDGPGKLVIRGWFARKEGLA